MFEKWRIKEHMEVADSAGRHVGTVDEIIGDSLKLTRSDASDGSHHFVDMEWVDRIDDNRVYLKPATPLPLEAQNVGQPAAPAGEVAAAGSASANYAGSEPSPDLPGTESRLFGTSGLGTGMGGSGST